MKILAIGGSGGMGRFAVDAAQHFENVESIVVADVNEASAQAFAAKQGNGGADGTRTRDPRRDRPVF